MQTLSDQHPNTIHQQTRKIAVVAILLFALSGLISGFAVGAFTHSKSRIPGTTTPASSGTTPVTQMTRTPVSTAGTKNVNLDFPVIKQGEDFRFLQIANGNTGYTFSASILNKNQTPIQVPDVTCKLWLTQNRDINSILAANNYAMPREIEKIQQPFPDEVVGYLNYISPSQQIQPCSQNGKTSWNYTISPSINPGIYYFVVLADWRGKSFKWSWVSIEIKRAS
jgi:hypothetical protein